MVNHKTSTHGSAQLDETPDKNILAEARLTPLWRRQGLPQLGRGLGLEPGVRRDRSASATSQLRKRPAPDAPAGARLTSQPRRQGRELIFAAVSVRPFYSGL